MNKIVGIKKTEMTSGRHEGEVGITYYYTASFTSYESENSNCDGLKIGSEFSYTDFGVKVGDHVEMVYEKGFQDKAILVNILPVPASATSKH